MRSCLALAAALFVGLALAEEKTVEAPVTQEQETQGEEVSMCEENPSLSICRLHDALLSAMEELQSFTLDLDEARAEKAGTAQKRKSPFMRFGKRKSPFMRFGKRKSPFMRFGRSGPADEHQDMGMEKRKSTYLRFG